MFNDVCKFCGKDDEDYPYFDCCPENSAAMKKHREESFVRDDIIDAIISIVDDIIWDADSVKEIKSRGDKIIKALQPLRKSK